jgi:hypothetical protein
LSAAPQLIVTLTTDQLAELVETSAARAVAKLVASQQQEVMSLSVCAALLDRNEEIVMRVLVKKKGLPVHYISDREPRFKRSEILAWLDALPSKAPQGEAN